jgi:predicted ATP-grasp superfamily ATP-dependent carboligase
VAAEENLLIFGASARAAAFSALRAGLQPWCVDLFADADLVTRCPTVRLSAARYPHGFLEYAQRELPGPWIYTGALENRPELIETMSRIRTLWGNEGAVLAIVRSPTGLADLLHRAGSAHPAIHRTSSEVPKGGRWLLKPRRSAGGAGIRLWKGEVLSEYPDARWYLQEYIEGEPRSAVYAGVGPEAHLLGVTRQLVGETWLNAAPFCYCGSIGPLQPTPPVHRSLARLGKALVQSERVTTANRVRGVFGVDFILRDQVPWPVEVNPRYTASVEVLEYARRIPAMAWHRRGFDPRAPVPRDPVIGATEDVVGKAILFARAPLVFPADGPWTETLKRPPPVEEPPAFADIPSVGEPIKARRPILTFFARAVSEAACLDALWQIARDLDRWLFRA